MNILHWFDNRTALACQALVGLFFAASILLVHRANRHIRGASTIAFGFLIGPIGIVLVALRGIIPNFISIVVANILCFIAYWFLYRGVRQHLGYPNKTPLATVLLALTCFLQFFFTSVHNNIVARIILIAVYVGIFRFLMAQTVFRNANRQIHRILFASILCVLSLVSFSRGFFTYRQGAPQNFMQQNAVQTYSMLSGILFAALEGAFCLILIGHEHTRRISRQAQQDPLTGTFNRRAIEEKLQEELARGARTGRTLCAALIDLDFFKTINDTLGHAAGDQALKQVADTIAAKLRPFDHLGRFGGDEFLLILPDVGIDAALPIANRFRAALATLPNALTLSIGLAESDPGESAPSLLARADAALYQAKDAGRDCIRHIRSGDESVPTPTAPTTR